MGALVRKIHGSVGITVSCRVFFCSVHTKQFNFTICITILYISILALALGPFEINIKTMLTCYCHSQQTFRPCLQGCNTTTDPGAMAPIRLLVKTILSFGPENCILFEYRSQSGENSGSASLCERSSVQPCGQSSQLCLSVTS